MLTDDLPEPFKARDLYLSLRSHGFIIPSSIFTLSLREAALLPVFARSPQATKQSN